jgi:hypothetical protein
MPANEPVGHTLYDGPSVLHNVLFANFTQRQASGSQRQAAYPLAFAGGTLASQKHVVSKLHFGPAGKPAALVAPGGGSSGLVDLDGSLAGGCLRCAVLVLVLQPALGALTDGNVAYR